jgi:hypothetical protein
VGARDAAVATGLVGGLAWLAKVGLIWANGGSNTDQGVVAVMYLLGLLGLAAASAAAGVALTAGRPVVLRVLGGAAGVIAFVVVFSVLDPVLSPLAAQDSWMRAEMQILGAAVLALLLVLVAVTVARRTGPSGRGTHAEV